jgi:polysaccharide export outer membrane protein
MRGARVLLAALVALAAAGCMRNGPDDVAGRGLFDTWASASQAYAQQQNAPPVYQPPTSGERGLMSSQAYVQQQYAPPASRQPTPGERGLMSSQTFARPQFAQQTERQPVAQSGRGLLDSQPGGRGLFETGPSAQQTYAQQLYAPPASRQATPGERGLLSSQTSMLPQFALQTGRQPAPGERGLMSSQTGRQSVAQSGRGLLDSQPGGRGLFETGPSAQQTYAQQGLQPPTVLQYRAPPAVQPQYAASPQYAGRSYAAADSYAAAAPYRSAYTLDAGDKLRVMVFGQDGISNAYIVDAGGNVNLPLIGTVPARGATTQQLSQRIAERLKQGYVREPHVTVEIETYRPFFILGEVTTPGQYPYVADMTVEKAIAIAGGFAPRAFKQTVELTHTAQGQPIKSEVPLNYPLRPGDTVLVKERWF